VSSRDSEMDWERALETAGPLGWLLEIVLSTESDRVSGENLRMASWLR
jgi:hypothetical protein